ncbi:Protein CBR-NHR-157 [Caenorhabditis briggsae]|uniref:Protein CBR-NHR-157 n=1 Tax=Caenorhabditis briggsae TaxID=6238 RepID=A8WJ84_CAEBR|nr:Protein CBR-NHR-157 [Caenorhabditis briggsae]CAP20526.1 Protein CBR-NHR-157 [Caenorhabditis briggsae]
MGDISPALSEYSLISEPSPYTDYSTSFVNSSFLPFSGAPSSPRSFNSLFSFVFPDTSPSCSKTSQSPTNSVFPTCSKTTLVPMENSFRKCVICKRPAFSHNYGVLSCDACKMFFRRVVTLNRDYQCKKGGACTPKEKTTTCKGCRFKLCQDSGMTFQPNFMDLKDTDQKIDVTNILGVLLFLDARRSKQMKTQFTDENFSLVQVLENRRMKLKARRVQNLTSHDWSFFGIYTSIEFFMSLDFMADERLQTKDKKILISSFCVKASLFASAMRAVKEKRDKLMTVDGKDVYPDEIMKFKQFSLEFLKRIRSLLVAKMIELRLTNEEFVLCNVILFCNPALLITGTDQDVIVDNRMRIHQLFWNTVTWHTGKMDHQGSRIFYPYSTSSTKILKMCRQ